MLHVIISIHLLVNHRTSFRILMDPEFKLPTGRRELKIGDSLKNNGTSFYGMKYDFKPSSEEYNESAMMDISSTNQVTLKYPQSSNEGSSDFMYSGTMKQFPKEYFLVIDNVTGDVTLEKLTATIQLKRTKINNNANKVKYQNKKPEKECLSSPELRANDIPSTSKKKAKRKQKTKETTNSEPELGNKQYGLISKHSPLHPSPSRSSPNESKSTQNPTSDYKFFGSTHSPEAEANSSQRTMLSLDDDESSMTGFESNNPIDLPVLTNMPQEDEFGLSATIGCISDSSTDSSSDSDSNSDSSSSSSSGARKKVSPARVNGYPNGSLSPKTMTGQLLKEDLQLSETGSDSD